MARRERIARPAEQLGERDLRLRVRWLARAALFCGSTDATRSAGESAHARVLADRDMPAAVLADLAGDLERRLRASGDVDRANRLLAHLPTVPLIRKDPS